MGSDVVIRAEGLGKSYRIGEHAERERYTALRDVLAGSGRSLARAARGLVSRSDQDRQARQEFWALRDVDFEIKRGEVVGIIGRNGAGKSTLLKILSRITEPTKGRVEIHGRVASLLEVGTGFHPELTGRENIFLNGAILGMSRAEIKRKFDEIVAFAEVEKFLDTPVKRYSSGMYVRLAFAVAAHLEPEILVVDEVLAVGDAEFQKKCLGKMQDVAGHGRTVLFVSHHLGSVSTLCGSVLLLNRGRLQARGPTDEVIGLYNAPASQGGAVYTFLNRIADAPLTPVLAYASALGEEPAEVFASDLPISVSIRYRATSKPEASCHMGIRLSDAEGRVIFTSASDDCVGGPALAAGEHVLSCVIPPNLLAPGRYYLSFAADIPMREILFNEENVHAIVITDQGAIGGLVLDGRRGVIRPGLEWTSSPAPPSARHQGAL